MLVTELKQRYTSSYNATKKPEGKDQTKSTVTTLTPQTAGFIQDILANSVTVCMKRTE